MDGVGFKAQLARDGLTQDAAARLLGASRRSVARWVKTESPPMAGAAIAAHKAVESLDSTVATIRAATAAGAPIVLSQRQAGEILDAYARLEAGVFDRPSGP